MTLPILSCLDAGLPTVEESLRFVSSRFSPSDESESVPLEHAAGRVIAQDFIAVANMPPWPRAAMDGFAFRSGSGAPLRLVGAATAGRPFQSIVGQGECVAISTGAAVPQGCDTVMMREQCERQGNDVWLGAPILPGTNVRPRGEDYRQGDTLLKAGTILDARAIGLLASTGARSVAVRRKLRVAIFSVGDELSAGPIFDSNRVMLKARLTNHQVTDLGLLPDSRARIKEVLANASAAHDVIISTAGTSVGDEDHVRAALIEAGGEILVSGVAIKPGKPVTCARVGRALYMALPGNPVAALVTFLALGEPLLHHLGGTGLRQARPCAVRAAFEHRKKKGMREYLRVTLQDSHADLPLARATRAGSAHLHALVLSDGLVCLDKSITSVSAGDILPCHLFSAGRSW